LKSKTQGIKSIVAGVVTGTALLVASSVAIAAPKIMCVFDPLGANGPIFSQLKDYQTESVGWGVDLTLKPYTDERIAAEDFKSGLCNAISVTGMRSRQFVPFTGTIDAIGAVPSYAILKSTLKTLSSKKAAKFMRSGPYEIAGILPIGAAYMFVNDRTIDTVGEMSGKKVALPEGDPANMEMVKNLGATPVASSIATMYSKFNNGAVDIVFGPGIIYEAMELYKGLEPAGGIIRTPILQLTMQMIIKADDFPAEFAQQSRTYVMSQFNRAVTILTDAEKKIPEKWWVSIPAADQIGYDEMFRQSRIALRDQGFYEPKTLTILRKIRCRDDPSKAECTAADKE